MTCKRAQNHLRRGLLNATSESGVSLHLAGCPQCAAYKQALAAAASELQSFRRIEPEPAFEQRILSGIISFIEQEAESAQSNPSGTIAQPFPRLRFRFAAAIIATASIAVIAIGVRILLPSRPAINIPAKTTIAAAAAAVSSHGERPSRPRMVRRTPPRQGRLSLPLLTSAPEHSIVHEVEDSQYLNADSAAVLAGWGSVGGNQSALLQKQIDATLRQGDDFVEVPFPMVAALDSRGLKAAIASYRRQKEAVDPRLTRHIDLAVKATALSELCAQLGQSAHVDISAGRTVADEKITAFCNEKPLRDVMRQITRVFGYHWERSGEEPVYSYKLVQDLRGQLAEEELRNRAAAAALVALDQQIRAKTDKPQDARWAVAQLYGMLNPQQFAALRSGQEVRFSTTPDLENAPMPPEIGTNILENFGIGGANSDGSPFKPTQAFVSFHMDRSELGEVKLLAERGGFIESGGGLSTDITLGSSRNPSTVKPDNAEANAALRKVSPWTQEVSLQPKHTCLRTAREGAVSTEEPLYSDEFSLSPIFHRGGEDLTPHVTSADVWEEVHSKTGLAIIADSYMRLYPRASINVTRDTLYDALCKAADSMGVRWKFEEGFVQARSTSFFTDKLKEVPNRLLSRWEGRGAKSDGMPIKEMLEMSTLSDEQLGSATVSAAIDECWGFPEWRLVGGYSDRLALLMLRPHARLLAQMSSEQLKQAQTPEGIKVSSLPGRLQQALADLWLRRWHSVPPDLAAMSIQAQYAPAGSYVWFPQRIDSKTAHSAESLPFVVETTRQAALEAARKFYPAASPAQVHRSAPLLAITYAPPPGQSNLFRWSIGKPRASYVPSPN